MSDALKNLFGGGSDDSPDDRVKKIGVEPSEAKSFVNRYLDGDPSEGFDQDEARTNFERVARNASPAQMQRATRRALDNMTGPQRSDFNRMLEERRAQGGTVPIQQAGDTARSGGGSGMGVDDILGGILGGGDDDRTAGRGGGDGGMLGDLGGLLGSPAGKALIGGIAAFGISEIMDGDK